MTKTVTTPLLWALLALVALPNAAQALPQEYAKKYITLEQAAAAQQLYAEYSKKAYPLEQRLAELRGELNQQDASSGASISSVRNIYKGMAEAKTQLFAINDELNSALIKSGITPADFTRSGESVRGNNCW